MADSRQNRIKFYWTNGLFLALVAGVLVLLNLTSDKTSRMKLDLTADKIYSISPGTVRILERLKDNVKVTYYCSQDLPSFLANILRDTSDMFEEFRKISRGKFRYELVSPEDRASQYAEERVLAYEKKRLAGETPEEPEPPQDIMQMFSGRQGPTQEQIREQRERDAAQIAKNTKRSKDEVRLDLLREEYKKKFFQELAQEEISPYIVPERTGSSVRQVRVYSAIKITYLNKPAELIPFHSSLEALEYELAQRIVKLTTDAKATLAFFDPRKPEMPPMNPMQPMAPPPHDYQAVTDFLGELFDVRQISLKEGDSIDDLVLRLKEDRERREREARGEKEPAEKEKDRTVTAEDMKLLSCLIVVQPENLEERQVYEINRAVSLGVPAIIMASPYSMDVSPQGVRQGIPIISLRTGLEDLFRKWGVQFGDEILASNQSGQITVERRMPGVGLILQQPAPLSMIVAPAGPAINQESPFTNRIGQLVFPATTGIKLLRETLGKNKLTVTELVKTSPETWSKRIDPFERLQNPLRKHQGMGTSVIENQKDLAEGKPDDFRDFLDDPMALALLIEGKLPFTFEGEPIPEWKKEDPEKKKQDPHAGLPGFGGHDFDFDEDRILDAVDPLGEDGPPAEVPPAAEAPAEEDEASAPVQEDEAPAPAPDATSPGALPEPAKKAEEKPLAHVEPADGRVLLLASADMLKNNFIRFVQIFPAYRENASFLQNAVELFSLDDTLLTIRRKQQAVRQFEQGSDRKALGISLLNVLLVPLLVAAVGLIRFLWRRSESIRYERQYIQSHR
jgi:ABC-type uncharacterized transport system involved in gliding motility auxiliary subunit